MGCGASAPSTIYDPNGPVGVEYFKQERVLGEGGFGKVRYVIKKDTQKGYAMKCMDKHAIVDKRHTNMVFKERSLLVDLSTPADAKDHCRFLTNLHFAFQDAHHVYLVMDLALGGTLKYHLKKHPKGYPESHVQFYAAQIYNGLMFLHSKMILYRDCKPENMLLNSEGYVMLSDFGVSEKFANSDTQMKGKTGTRAYMPPESLRGELYGLDFDWWSYGVTMYEILCAVLPNTKGQELQFPEGRSPAAQDLVAKLLDQNRATRLGVADETAIRRHGYFAEIDWDGLNNRTATAPFVPNSKIANFDAHQDDIMAALDVNQVDKRASLSPDDEAKFAKWPWPPLEGLPEKQEMDPTVRPGQNTSSVTAGDTTRDSVTGAEVSSKVPPP